MKQNSGMRRKQFEFGSSQTERPCNKSNDATTTIYYKVMSLEIIRCHMIAHIMLVLGSLAGLRVYLPRN